jgi:hypothetical protein
MHRLVYAVSTSACIARFDIGLSYPWWVYLVGSAAYTAWIFIGEISKNQRRIFSKRNPRPFEASLWIHALFLLLLVEYIQVAPTLASILPEWHYPSSRYLPPKLAFLAGTAFMALAEWRWLYGKLPPKSADSDNEGASSSAIEKEKR